MPRLWQLGAADLSQAEHHKLEAAAAWLGGHFIVDGEHPALFKALVTGSVALFGADPWALRLPNAFAGAGTAVLVALLGRRLVDPLTGWLAGGLMALGTLPVAIDRVGKEDTLMLALALAAVLVWLHAEDRPELWLAVAVLAAAAAAAKYEALPLLPALLGASRFGLGPPLPAGGGLARPAAAFVLAHLALNPLLLVPEQCSSSSTSAAA